MRMFYQKALTTILLAVNVAVLQYCVRVVSCVCLRRSGEQSRISWTYYPKQVMTNEIARSVIIT